VKEIDVDALAEDTSKAYEAISLSDRAGRKCVLQPYLLLPKEKRMLIKEQLDSAGTQAADVKLVVKVDEAQSFIDLLALTADDPTAWREMSSALNLATILAVMEEWKTTMQLPEASSSPN
jgi:hypothetical protein